MSKDWNIQTCICHDEITEKLYNDFIQFANWEIDVKGYFVCALSGGNTPIPVFKKLSKYDKENFWENIHIFWVDERYVLPKDLDSNFGTAYRHFIKFHPNTNYYSFDTSMSLEDAAIQYEKEIKDFFKSRNTPVYFDLLFLGMGEDGHVASLFPDSEGLNENSRLVISNYIKQLEEYRLTFTFKLLNCSKKAMMGVIGEKKIEVLNKAEEGVYIYPLSKIEIKNYKIYTLK